MSSLFSSKPIAIFWSYSDSDLNSLCQKLQARYDLPNFAFDEHSTWEYANSAGNHLGFDVTRTKRLDTIATWLEGAPKGVNYQIILYADTNVEDIANVNRDIDAQMQEVHQYLTEVLGNQVILYIPRDKQRR